MSGQRHVRIAALIIGCFGALGLLWLGVGAVRGAAPAGWWLEAGFHALLVLAAVGLYRGSDLAWFGAVVVFACAGVVGLGGLLDLAFAAGTSGVLAIARSAALVAAGAYGLWALLLSREAAAFRASHRHRPRFALPAAMLVLAACALGIGWYLDSLSPATQRMLALQVGIAALFAALVAWLATRNREAPLRWEYLPLVLAGVVVVANLDAVTQLRQLRPLAQALRTADPAARERIAAHLPPDAARITGELARARDRFLADMDAAAAAYAPWKIADVLRAATATYPAAVAAALDRADTASLQATTQAMDARLARFVGERRRIIGALPETVRRLVEPALEQEEDAWRSHYGVRLNLLSRARMSLTAMLRVLAAQPGKYSLDWQGEVVLQDPGAARDYAAGRAAFEELKLWDARLRAEGQALAEERPAWRWLAAVD